MIELKRLRAEVERLREIVDVMIRHTGQVTLRLEIRYEDERNVLIITGPKDYESSEFAELIASHLRELNAAPLDVDTLESNP